MHIFSLKGTGKLYYERKQMDRLGRKGKKIIVTVLKESYKSSSLVQGEDLKFPLYTHGKTSPTSPPTPIVLVTDQGPRVPTRRGVSCLSCVSRVVLRTSHSHYPSRSRPDTHRPCLWGP